MRIGVVGAGQLGRMLGLAGLPLECGFRFLDPSERPPAAAVGDHLRAAFDDAGALRRLARESDVLTYEFENAAVEALAEAAGDTPVWPPLEALAAAQDRAREKRLFESVGIGVPPWRTADDQPSLERAVAELGFPAIVKTRRFGYDGKGQRRLRGPDDLAGAFAALGEAPLLVERLVDFEREVSVIGTRGGDGSRVIYPLVENVHRDGILVSSRAPAPLPDGDQALQREAGRLLAALLDALDYVGTLAIELFVAGGRLLGNEFAPRVHNSGHWTIEGARTSQFENHVRAVAGLPLGDAAPTGHSGLLNIIGRHPPLAALLATPEAHYHGYAKAARPGRKLGHVTVVADSSPARDAMMARLETVIGKPETATRPL